ncbi:Pheophytinase, chloroplastic [Linum grandiflorum]
MEVIPLSTTPRVQVFSLRRQVVTRDSKPPISLARSKPRSGFSISASINDFGILKGPKKSKSKVLSSGKTNSYVIGEDELDSVVPSEGGSVTGKVLIPGLPDEPSSASVSSGFWEWKPKLNVHYERAGCENLESPQVLFLPGFGVGSFHYEKQLKDLGRQYRVWAVDFLGQGLSLPVDNPTSLLVGQEGESASPMWGFGDEAEPWASELVYSVDLWRDQVRYFVEEVIGEPVYIVGNSLGGYVALYFAAAHPELVKGVTLLNATPFWGFLPNPVKSPALARVFTWSGTFPLPPRVKKIMHFLWLKFSDPGSIAEILKQVYADHSTDVEKVFSRIVEITQHPAAAAAFTSIMFAPRGELSFTEALSRCKTSNIPICLVYGKEDPWVNPIWGHLAKREVPQAPYYELSPAGHCPHDEVPEVVNYILRGWIKNLESGGSFDLPLLDYGQSVQTDTSKRLEFVRGGSKKSVDVRLFGSGLTFWEQMRFNVSSQLGKLKQLKPVS